MKKSVILLMLIFLSCSQDEYINEDLDNLAFEQYLNSFLQEASIRGYDYSNNRVNFYFADIVDNDVSGLCYSNNDRIIIDRGKWNNSGEIGREWLIFHELGHCILNRQHKNEKTNSGECLSYMKGKENSFDCSNNLFSSLWKKYYLDELFDENTVLPTWYTANQQYDYNYNNIQTITSIQSFNTDLYVTNLNLNDIDKIVLEFTFKNWEDNLLVDPIVETNFGGCFFSALPASDNQRIHITNGTVGNYYFNNQYQFNSDIKFTIRKNSNLVQFFIDEEFIHATEINSYSNNLIKASFNELIDMDINVFTFN